MVKHQNFIIFVFISIMFVVSNMRGPIAVLGPLANHIQQQLTLSSGQIGLLTSSTLFIFAIFSPIVPKIVEKYSLITTINLSTILIGGGSALRFVNHFSTLLIGTMIIGMGIAICNVILPTICREYFPNVVGKINGFFITFMVAASAIISAFALPITVAYSWQLALGYAAFPSIITLILWLIIQRKTPVKKQQQVKTQVTTKIKINLLVFAMAGFIGAQSFVFYALLTWLPAMLQDFGYSDITSGLYLSYFQLVSLPTSLLAPMIAEKYRQQVGIASIIGVVLIVSLLGLLLFPQYALLWVIICGLSCGGAFSLAMLYFIFRTTSASETTQASSIGQGIGYAIAALAPFIIGQLYDMTSNWTMALLVIIIFAIISMLSSIYAGMNRKVQVSEDK